VSVVWVVMSLREGRGLVVWCEKLAFVSRNLTAGTLNKTGATEMGLSVTSRDDNDGDAVECEGGGD